MEKVVQGVGVPREGFQRATAGAFFVDSQFPPTPTMLFPLEGCTFPYSLHGVQSRAACGYRSLLHSGLKASLPSCVLCYKQEKHFLTASLGMNWTDGPLGLNVCVLEMGVCVSILLTRTCFKRK